jgi:putative Ca2+/H+ antiporter (TMEM165/GDT1 family)
MDLFILLTVYGILFLGELGDKTQLIVFNISLEHEKSYKVGIGATLGFGAIVTLGVFFGSVITNYIPLNLISLISGIVFVVIGVLDARNLKLLYLKHYKLEQEENNESRTEEDRSSKYSKLKNNPYIAGFGFIFLMELGDKTQILTITLASIYNLPIEVWLGSFLALTTLAWIGVLFGEIVARKVPKFHLKVISVSIFIIIGIMIIVTSV